MPVKRVTATIVLGLELLEAEAARVGSERRRVEVGETAIAHLFEIMLLKLLRSRNLDATALARNRLDDLIRRRVVERKGRLLRRDVCVGHKFILTSVHSPMASMLLV